ncbi:MAG: hypothetical protein C4519_09260 [Desulfobacteraceae bacterium]|nr:MAG: hypothetical protein C4519_09260 [Desulfobacteraceae bacterium]
MKDIYNLRNLFIMLTFYISRIFDWFADDFGEDIVGFFRKYAAGDLKKVLDDRGDRIRIAYLDYDWSLNGK